MEALLNFVRGPLFRLCFAIMVLGLARILILDLTAAYKAYHKAGNKKMPWKLIFRRTFEWLFPFKKMKNNPQVYSFVSIIFHIGLISVPIFLFAHINLWNKSLGISWPALSHGWAFGLTLMTITAALILLIFRLSKGTLRFLSRGQDYLWLLLLLIPFTTGFICANLKISAQVYQFCMLTHVLSGELIFVLMPFTKIAHGVLTPFSQLIDALAWKFPPETDEVISKTLNKQGAPV